MGEKKADRRTAKTQKAIINAFASLLAEKELNKITVREISDRADINRATFYKHYLDVYDLYERVEKDILIEWSSLILQLEELEAEEFFKCLVSYISGNRDIFKMVFSPNPPSLLRMKQLMSEALDTNLSDERLSFMSCYRAQGCLALLSKWISEGFVQSDDLIVQIMTELDSNTEKII